jgi:hypothetical protein
MTEICYSVTPCDGCGRCLVGVIRLSRMTDKTSSPQKQVNHILAAAAAAGAHIIAGPLTWRYQERRTLLPGPAWDRGSGERRGTTTA